MQNFLMVGLGGALGAMSRYGIYVYMGSLNIKSNWATLAINLVGSLIIGILAGLKPNQLAVLLLGVGFCGGFTTFSTFSMDGFKLLKASEMGVFALYYSLSIIGGLILAWVGYNLTAK